MFRIQIEATLEITNKLFSYRETYKILLILIFTFLKTPFTTIRRFGVLYYIYL